MPSCGRDLLLERESCLLLPRQRQRLAQREREPPHLPQPPVHPQPQPHISDPRLPGRLQVNVAPAKRPQQPRHPPHYLPNLPRLAHQGRIIRGLGRRSRRRQRLPQRRQFRVEHTHRKVVQRQRRRPPLHVAHEVFLPKPPLLPRLHPMQLPLPQQPVERRLANAQELRRCLQRKQFLLQRSVEVVHVRPPSRGYQPSGALFPELDVVSRAFIANNEKW